MTTKGTPTRKFRIPDETWNAASAAFPAEPGKSSGLSVEIQGFVMFLAECPGDWTAIKSAAAEQGVDPWELIRTTVPRAT